ncbi:hypothetical protein BGW38_004539 [Lunasporangiospora selenospora]|uniref:G domain-containing protein n=1 Tax=Lunasporangiospora selenospora TaxID=979761 RepID=A0A9P6G2T4_9FUNG|nr:hypothetical protein BGW38_004539 [Lunasporangiospora selenospora]
MFIAGKAKTFDRLSLRHGSANATAGQFHQTVNYLTGPCMIVVVGPPEESSLEPSGERSENDRGIGPSSNEGVLPNAPDNSTKSTTYLGKCEYSVADQKGDPQPVKQDLHVDEADPSNIGQDLNMIEEPETADQSDLVVSSSLHVGEESMNSVELPVESKNFNILVIGPSQSGKSTLIEAIREYLDPNREIDHSKIGNGSESCTKEVIENEFASHIPKYELINAGAPSQTTTESTQNSLGTAGAVVDIKRLQGASNWHLYKNALRKYDLRIRSCEQNPRAEYKFRIFDTPGLEDTDGHDVRNVAKILNVLSAVNEIHLILITIAHGTPLTQGVQNALKDYCSIFSEMNGLFTFVHTKVSYEKLHPGSQKYYGDLTTRMDKLDSIMGQPVRHIAIDSDFDEDRPLCIYMRREAIREILSLTNLNVPVAASQMRLIKTKRMREVDSIVIKEQEAHSREIRWQLLEVRSKRDISRTQVEAAKTREISALKIKIDEARFEYREKQVELNGFDTDTLEFLFERSSQESRTILDFFPSRRPRVPLEVARLEFQIDDIREERNGYDIVHSEGGEGSNFWKVVIERKVFRQGDYRAKFYAKRCNRQQAKVTELKAEVERRKETVQKLYKNVEVLENSVEVKDDDEIVSEKKNLESQLRSCQEILTRAKRTSLHFNLFKAVAEAGVYEGEATKCAEKVAAFYENYTPALGEEVLLDDIRNI